MAFAALSRNPKQIEQELAGGVARTAGGMPLVVIDEIQRLPELLNEIHRLIERRSAHFVLTGSSARKLRRGGVNLLGGRAHMLALHPFVHQELREHFDLDRALNYGLLPPVYLSDAPEQDLRAYVGLYLREEVAAESLARNIPAFSRFLQVAAVCNGMMINHTRIASDAQVARATVVEYFEILKDTLVGSELPAWRQSVRRKPITTSRFYFFDPGVARMLQGRSGLTRGTPEYGTAMETYLHHELRAWCDYRGQGQLHYWRSTSGFEVDFILNNLTAIEAKSGRVGPGDLKGLRALRDERALRNYLCVTTAGRPRIVDDIRVLPINDFLNELWGGAFG